MSNFDDVIAAFRDTALRREIAARAHSDLIATGDHTYRGFIRRFDDHLASVGVVPAAGPDAISAARGRLAKGARRRQASRRVRYASYLQFPGRPLAVAAVKPIVQRLRRHRASI